MVEKQIVECPLCGAEQEETIPEGTKWGFEHPVDGDWRAKDGDEWVVLPFEQLPWWRRIWSNKFFFREHRLRKQKVIARMVRCKECNGRFHLEFFDETKDRDTAKWIFRGDNKEMLRVIIDKLLDRFPLPYVLTSLMMGLLVWGSWFIVVSLFGRESKMNIELVLSVSSCVVFIITLVAVKSHANRIRNLPSEVWHIVDLESWMRDYIIRGWVQSSLGTSHHRFRAPDVFGFCAAIIGIAYRVLLFLFNPAPLNLVFESYLIEYYVEFVITTVIWALFYFILGTSLYLSLSTAWLMQRIGYDVPIRVNPLDRSGGLAPFGRLALSAVLSLTPALLMGSFNVWSALALEEHSVVIIIYVALLLLGVGIAAGVFFISLYSIHHVMKKEKIRYTSSISEAWNNEFEKFMGKVRETKTTSEDFSVIRQLSNTYKDISQMREWPYEFGTIVKLGLSLSSPILTFAVSTLIQALQ